jgi:uncharacterized repeat protein (TIGR01451 family)
MRAPDFGKCFRLSLTMSMALAAMSIGMAQTVTADPSTSATWPVGKSFEPGEVAATTDPLGPFSRIPVEFRGWANGGSQVSLSGQPCSNNSADACLVFAYHLSFAHPTSINAIAFTGDAFNGATFQLLDSTGAVIASRSVSSGNVGHPVTYFLSTPGAVGTSFTVKLFDTSTTWTYVSNILINAGSEVTKTFGALAIPVGGSTNLSFTLTNRSTATLTGLAFTDTLPAGLTVAMPNGLTGLCGGGTITALAGGNTVALNSAMLSSGASCTFTVNVTGAARGTQSNTTSLVSSNESLPGAAGSANLFVCATEVTSQVGITMQPFTANRNARNPNWCTVLTFTNNVLPPDRTTRATSIPGPIELVLTNLNVQLENAVGTLLGSPFVVIQPSALPPGGQASVPLCFLNPNGGPINFVPRVFSGSLF